jgi:hypothetical protein
MLKVGERQEALILALRRERRLGVKWVRNELQRLHELPAFGNIQMTKSPLANTRCSGSQTNVASSVSPRPWNSSNCSPPIVSDSVSFQLHRQVSYYGAYSATRHVNPLQWIRLSAAFRICPGLIQTFS